MHLIHTIPVKCTLREDCGWVCENHTHKPWEGEHACNCGLVHPALGAIRTTPSTRRRCRMGSTRWANVISARGWSLKFDDPIASMEQRWRQR